MAEPELDLYFQVLQTLETLKIDYVIIGAFAGVSYGVTRTTFDIDIVVDLQDSQVDSLVAAFPPPRYYADPFQIRDSIKWGILFNIIDSSAGRKVDLIPLSMQPGYWFALNNRIRRTIPASTASVVEAWFARPEDVIIGKLMAWSDGHSFKHELDIRDMLIAVQLGDDPEIASTFDVDYINDWAKELGAEVQQLWENLQQLAQYSIDETEE